MVKISLVVCTSLDYGIGFKNKIPWIIKEDTKYFKDVTMGNIPNINPIPDLLKSRGIRNAIVMGRNTWSSINKPLSGRLNIIISKTLTDIEKLDEPFANPGEEENLYITDTLEGAIKYCKKNNIFEIFIIGGNKLYEDALNNCDINFIYLNKLNRLYECDVYFPHIPTTFEVISSENIKSVCDINGISERSGDLMLTTSILSLRNDEEYQYLNLVKDILENGSTKSNRTSIDTLSIFGRTMTFSLKNNKIPLLTTKRTWFKGVCEELLWFLSGSIDSKVLEEKGINIWKGNTSREFLDKNGFTERKEGSIGPGYSFQWRFFGAKYIEGKTDYTGEGFDQISHIVNLIKNNPNSRRIILNSWDPSTVDNSSLNPCHVLAQFDVTDGFLNCQMYQRSCDILLGCPFNIASYSILTIMLAHVCNIKPGNFIHVIGDAHIYSTHVEALKEQITKIPYKFPTLKISGSRDNIFDLKYSDFLLENYLFHKSTIKCEMVV